MTRRQSNHAWYWEKHNVFLLLFTAVITLWGCEPQEEPVETPPTPFVLPNLEVRQSVSEIKILRLDVSPVVGKWEVVDYHITPVAAIDEDAALGWLGQLVVYTADVVGFQEELCEAPSFREHRERFAEYFKDFEVNPTLFEIQEPDVDVISIDCNGVNWSGPGAEVIRVQGDSLLIVYDGVFLTMEPY